MGRGAEQRQGAPAAAEPGGAGVVGLCDVYVCVCGLLLLLLLGVVRDGGMCVIVY